MRCCNLCVTRKVMQTRCQQPGDPECFLRGAFVGTSFRAASGNLLRCGSYGYAAPEIMLNHWQAVDVCKIDLCYSWLPLRYTYAVDLYSYGVMLYMLVSGGETSQRSPATGAR